MSETALRAVFPRLGNNFRITSAEAPSYNCVSWVVGDISRPWWPDPSRLSPYYWPPDMPREESLMNFIGTFRGMGYERCEILDLEEGFEKIAIFVTSLGIPTHVTRQLRSGKWTSKLGRLEDIEHDLPSLVANEVYGGIAAVMRRALTKEG